ncbi:hypothetical protein Tco_1374846 [Tanacetum coccineum]
MSQYAQNEIPVAYPPAQQGASYVMAPPPVGYPLKDGAANPENQVPVQTQSRVVLLSVAVACWMPVSRASKDDHGYVIDDVYDD